jgi:hypothetical protein
MFNAGTVMAKDVLTRALGRSLGNRLIEKLGRAPDAAWLFCSPDDGLEEFLQGVNDTVGADVLVGCTTDGEISSAGLTLSSAVLGGIVCDQIVFHAASVTGLGSLSEERGRELGEKLPPGVRYVQVFSDGLTGNGSAILRGLHAGLNSSIPIAGGAAGDAGRFIKTRQFHGRKLLTDSAVAIGFSGDFLVGTGVRSGWLPVGVAKKVTRSEGNIVYELDGQPALEVYRRFLGKHADKLPAVGVEYPLGLIDESGDVGESDYHLLRAPMSVNAEDGSIAFAGEIPEGSSIRLTLGDHSSILQGARQAAEMALEDIGNAVPAMVFLYSCMARKIVLGMRTQLELERVKEVLGIGLPVLGFYTYGEYSPVRRGGPSLLHNETATVSVIGIQDAHGQRI